MMRDREQIGTMQMSSATQQQSATPAVSSPAESTGPPPGLTRRSGAGASDRVLPAPLPGWRRYICRAQNCRYSYETPSMATAPDCCSVCGAPWRAVAQTVGPRAHARS
jgi:hypothetical protein